MQEIGIVIPCYNEASRLSVEGLCNFIEEQKGYFFYLVNDGSKDGTLKVLTGIQKRYPEKVFVLDLKKNFGKAEAVRRGILKALSRENFEYIGYLDADFSTPLSELNHLAKYCDLDSYDMVFGSRVKRMGAYIQRSAYRHYLGRIFSTFSSGVLKIPVYDTQCGAKLIKRDLALYVFDKPFMSRWLFDVEIFARIIHVLGFTKTTERLLEVPLNYWVEKGNSTLKWKDFLKAPIELFQIHRKYRIKQY